MVYVDHHASPTMKSGHFMIGVESTNKEKEPCNALHPELNANDDCTREVEPGDSGEACCSE